MPCTSLSLRAAVPAVILLSLAGISVLGRSPTSASFPGDNGKIAFYTGRDGAYEIYSMNADGTDQTRLTNSLGYDTSPSWSADGLRIVFSSTRDGADVYDHAANEIYTMNEDGSLPNRLTNDNAADIDASWSPDGMRVAFSSDRNVEPPGAEIYTMNEDGSNQVRLTNGPLYEQNVEPSWSPDGSKIAFSGSREGARSIFVMGADGTGQEDLTHATYPIFEFEPSWSPDGTRIAFVSTRQEPEQPPACDPCNFDIFVMNSDGSGITRLTTEPANDSAPSWSPDGSKIAFQSDRSGDLEIYVMDAGGNHVVQLTDVPGANVAPDWQPLAPPTPVPLPVGGVSREPSLGTRAGASSEGFWTLVGVITAGGAALGSAAWYTRRRVRR